MRANTFVAYYPADRNFFLSMMVITWAAIVSGFGYEMVQRSQHGTLHFPLIVHFHAAAFIGWLVLFTVQVILIRSKNLALHKKLGIVAARLIPVMVVLGVVTAIITERLEYGTPTSDLHFMSVMLGSMLLFGILGGAGFYLRKNYVAHKRLMLVATLALTDAGFGRWFSYKIAPFFGDFYWNYKTLSEGSGRFFVFETLPSLTLILAVGVYDLVTRKKLNKAYVWALALFLAVNMMAGYLYFNGTWFEMMKRLVVG
jgi:hypothetical protein